ncbi:hypothetical protein JYK02_27410 [Corallococcus macrosporus]|uniref:Lipoprotein n=1 Tax=Corallococcus macrosporus TaxID=35 RepID=A0ABS3DIT9_9BACT|nr:hypothetical protein [Corallococcus macrosporus]MBN8231252.1 hypothetical protein [Corallococcus macrosporus]
MTRSIPALALAGLLFGCGGMPEEAESTLVSEAQSPDVAPPEASAGEVSASQITTVTIAGSSVRYNSDTDNFVVSDTAADGHSAVAHIYNYNTGNYTMCWNSQGAGTTRTCDRSFANGINIAFRACTGEAGPGTLVACSVWVRVGTSGFAK